MEAFQIYMAYKNAEQRIQSMVPSSQSFVKGEEVVLRDELACLSRKNLLYVKRLASKAAKLRQLYMTTYFADQPDDGHVTASKRAGLLHDEISNVVDQRLRETRISKTEGCAETSTFQSVPIHLVMDTSIPSKISDAWTKPVDVCEAEDTDAEDSDDVELDLPVSRKRHEERLEDILRSQKTEDRLRDDRQLANFIASMDMDRCDFWRFVCVKCMTFGCKKSCQNLESVNAELASCPDAKLMCVTSFNQLLTTFVRFKVSRTRVVPEQHELVNLKNQNVLLHTLMLPVVHKNFLIHPCSPMEVRDADTGLWAPVKNNVWTWRVESSMYCQFIMIEMSPSSVEAVESFARNLQLAFMIPEVQTCFRTSESSRNRENIYVFVVFVLLCTLSTSRLKMVLSDKIRLRDLWHDISQTFFHRQTNNPMEKRVQAFLRNVLICPEKFRECQRGMTHAMLDLTIRFNQWMMAHEAQHVMHHINMRLTQASDRIEPLTMDQVEHMLTIQMFSKCMSVLIRPVWKSTCWINSLMQGRNMPIQSGFSKSK